MIEITPKTDFGRAMSRVIADRRPRRIIETGTYEGLGSTRTIVDAIKAAQCDADFHSIECNPKFHAIARENLLGEPVALHLGLSIPRSLLPAPNEIAEWTVTNEKARPGVYHDYPAETRVSQCIADTEFDVPDGLLQKLVKAGPHCDLFLLDSAGHVGIIEFNHCLEIAPRPYVLALDDVRHIKHFHSALHIQSHPNEFKIIARGDERFGWLVVEVV